MTKTKGKTMTKKNTWEERKCSCVYAKNGKLIGLCLRCAMMRSDAISGQEQRIKKEAKEEMGKALRMEKKKLRKPNSYGYNKAVEELNQKLDSYLKDK